jgi:AraC-like DNA-binding protein
MEVLAEILATTRIGAAIYGRIELRPPFAMGFDRRSKMGFHVVERGRCVLTLGRPDDEPGRGEIITLEEGDVVMFPRGWAHAVSDRAGREASSYAEVIAEQQKRRQGEPQAALVCGAYGFDPETPHPLLAALPAWIHVPRSRATAALRGIVGLLLAEIGSEAPGASTAARRLLDVLFIHVLRDWIARQPAESRGWLVALRDPALQKALTALHADPARAWTLPALAREAAVSRATLARRFADDVGEAPLAYLRRWRLTLAAQALRDTRRSTAAIAELVGYTSTVAFQKAFLRDRGVSPSAYRRAHERAFG